MNELINKLIESVGTSNGAVLSVSAATVGSSITPVQAAIADPTWFAVVAPILQTGAWAVAIIAGIITIKNGLFRSKKK